VYTFYIEIRVGPRGGGVMGKVRILECPKI
jgi:hypothetical protein